MLAFRTLLAGAFALVQLAFGVAAQSTFPPAPPQKIAVNALTNKVYTANYEADTVTAFNAATGTSATIAVGDGPLYVAVNPVTNRVYVNNARASSISVIDGATDTLLATYPVGSTGPIAVNPLTNVVYVVRLTGTERDEVTYFNGATNSWYSIAVLSYQPVAVAVNPVTNKLFVASYATGDVRIIDGTYNESVDHPTSVSRGVWSKPVALAVNPVTNKAFILTEDSRGPIAVLDANTLTTQFLLAGTARVPKAVAVNTVTNKAYALFSNELVVIDGATLATTAIPVADAGSANATLGVNTATNRILVASATGVLTVVDGSTDTVITTAAVPAGTSGVAINAATGTSYFDTALHAVPRAAGEATVANPVTTTITPLAGDTTGPDFTLTLDAASSFAPNALPVRAVYYQLDSTTGPWIAASGTGPYTAAFSGLAPGTHTVHAFAVEGQDAPLATGAHSAPLLGTMASYTFSVASPKADPSVSLASSSNPSTAGSQVTFTASVSGSSGTATGTVTFRDGAAALCSGVALASGSATCSSAALTAGTHDITAQYSGDANYNPGASGVLQQQVSPAPTVPGAPTNVVAAPGDGQATISFTAPADNGGSPITGYTVACTPGPVTGSGAASPITVTGLTNGTTYACSVRATSAIGTGAASASVNVTPQAGAFQLTVSRAGSGSGTITSSPAGINCGSTCAASFSSGAGVALSATAGAGSVFAGWSGACTGTGACSVTMNGAKTLTATFNLAAPADPPRMGNISTRMQVLTGNDVMIGGFVIGGSANKTVVVRARGPSLVPFGITNALANPMLQLVRSSDQQTIAANDDWQSASNAADVSASGFAPPNALESAILVSLPPGAYTAIVSGAGNGTGVGVVEVFEVDAPASPLANISTRGQVLTGDDVMIGGLVITGSGPQTVVVRARGPSLAPFGIANALANPQLQLVRSSDQSVLASNDDWQAAGNADDIAASGFAPSSSLESAILITLQPGAYTAIVTGAGGGTGVGIVEVFAVTP